MRKVRMKPKTYTDSKHQKQTQTSYVETSYVLRQTSYVDTIKGRDNNTA